MHKKENRLMPAFRKAARKDIEALVEIENTSFAGEIYDNARFVAEDFKDLLQDPARKSIVVLFNDAAGVEKVAGYAIVSFSRKTRANLDSIGISPGFQGRGLGRALLEKAEAMATANGRRTMTLEVHEKNVAAIELYRKNGYETVGREDHYYGDGTAALRMRKKL